MWVKERHRHIMKVLESDGQISATDLAAMLDVSRETVRRDLVDLENKGLVNRVHGGALLSQVQAEPSFHNRKDSQITAKRDIARKAAGLVHPNQTIFVDAGTTTSIFAQELARLADVTVITNSIEIARTIHGAGARLNLLLLGGAIVSDVPATYGELTLSEIRQFHADLAFVAPVALDAEKGAFDYELHEAAVATAMVEQSEQAVILVDHTKLGRTSRVKCCDLGQADLVVTDKHAPESAVAPFQARDTRIMA